MSKKKEEKQKKVPFNVLRKGAAALALAGVMVASPFVFTGCSDKETDSEDTTQETQTETKYVVDMDVVYEYDNKGELWAIYTYTYSDGTTSEERAIVPKRITQVQNICLSNGQMLEKFVKLDNAASVPELYVSVMFDDLSTGKVVLTNDMFVNNQASGYSIPDFTKKGTYNYQLSYRGKMGGGTLEIVDLADYAGNTVTGVRLVDQSILVGTALKNIVASITYDNSTNVYAPLSLVAGKYDDLKNDQLLDTIDTSVVGTYNVKPKDAFKFKESSDPDADYVEDIDTLYIYSRDCTINHIEVRDLDFSIGDTDYETKLKEKTFEAYLFEENDKGQTSVTGKVEDLDYDLKYVNINRVGQYVVPFTYQLEGQEGVYKSELYLSVEADLSSSTPVETYTIEPTAGGMFSNSPIDTIELHNVQKGSETLKVALVYNATMGKDNGPVMQADYELIDSGATLKLFDNMMNAYAFYDVDDSAEEVSAYTKATGTPTNYTGEIEMMEDMYDITLSVYGTTGTCVALVTVTMDMGSGPQAMPYAFVECSWVDSDTIEFAGRTFNVTTGNVLVEVTE